MSPVTYLTAMYSEWETEKEVAFVAHRIWNALIGG